VGECRRARSSGLSGGLARLWVLWDRSVRFHIHFSLCWPCDWVAFGTSRLGLRVCMRIIYAAYLEHKITRLSNLILQDVGTRVADFFCHFSFVGLLCQTSGGPEKVEIYLMKSNLS
jgi:hypothetical protein